MVHSVFDPLDRRRPEDLLAAAPESIDLFGQGVDSPFGLDERLRECLAASALSDEVDEIAEPAPLRQ